MQPKMSENVCTVSLLFINLEKLQGSQESTLNKARLFHFCLKISFEILFVPVFRKLCSRCKEICGMVIHLKYDLVEITNKMQPCIRIYYSTVH